MAVTELVVVMNYCPRSSDNSNIYDDSKWRNIITSEQKNEIRGSACTEFYSFPVLSLFLLFLICFLKFQSKSDRFLHES